MRFGLQESCDFLRTRIQVKAWLHAQGRALQIEEAELNGLDLVEKLNEVWGLPARPTPPADGVEQAVAYLLKWLA